MLNNSLPGQEKLIPDDWFELVEAKSDEDLKKVLEENHPADIADLVNIIPFEFQLQIIQLLDNQIAAEVLAELDEDDLERILPKFSDEQLSELIKCLPSDDLTDILGQIEPDRIQEILSRLTLKKRQHVNELLQYDLSVPQESWTGLSDMLVYK